MSSEKKKYPVRRLIHLGLIILFFIASVFIIINIQKNHPSFNNMPTGRPMLTYHSVYIHYPGEEAVNNGIAMFLALVIIYLLLDFLFLNKLKGWKSALSVIISIIIILGGTELSMAYYSKTYPRLHRPHPTLLWEHTPNYSGTTFAFNEKIFINSHGFRSPEISKKKPPGQVRIMLLGDSSAYGFQVQNNETFGSVLARKLRSEYPGKDIRLINAAVAGWTTYQATTFMKERGWQYSPDIIIIAFNNDCGREWKEDIERVPPARLIPLLRILYRSNIYMGLKKAVFNERLKKNPESAIWPRYNQGKTRVTIEQFNDNLISIINAANKRNVKVIMVSMPLQMSDFVKKEYCELLKNLAEEKNYPYINFTGNFKEYPPEEVFIDIMHPTVKGHKIIGEKLGGIIMERQWLEN